MARQRFYVTVCDICGEKDNLTLVRLGMGKARVRNFDVCAKHAKPLAELFETSGRKQRTHVSDIRMVDPSDLKSGKAGTPRTEKAS